MDQYTFLYKATNSDGKTVTERIQAENRLQAKYFLEIRGYSEIDFQNGEWRDEASKMFENQNDDPRNKLAPEIELEIQFLGLFEGILYSLKAWAIVWLPLLGWTIYNVVYGNSVWLSLTALIVFVIYFVFVNLPSMFYQALVSAGNWARWDDVRRLDGIIRTFNRISPLKIPPIELDGRLACADAAEGKLREALSRMTTYETDEQVSKFIYYAKMADIYEVAKDYETKLEYQERAVREFPQRSEGHLDCAFTMIRYFKDTSKAREYLNAAEEKEIGGVFSLFVPMVQGIIEFEEGDLQKAEFSLLNSLEKLKPYEKTGLFVGFVSGAKAYLSLVYGRIGNREKAENYLKEAMPILQAHKNTDLIRRCEEAVGR